METLVATVEETRALLAEAERAYHDLRIGQSVKVIVHQNGQRMEYTQASGPALKSYINELKAELGQSTVSGPMRVLF